MTIKELIEELSKLNPDMEVVTNGHSDCGSSYDDAYVGEVLPLKRYRNRSWRGSYYDRDVIDIYPEDESFQALVIE